MKNGFQETTIGNVWLKNCFIKTATYEGMHDNGIPNQKLLEHHVNMAKGNVALTTISYGAVSPDGRTFKDQMYIHDTSIIKLNEIASAVHNAGGKISIQLTHCGYFSKNTNVKRPLAPSRVFNEYGCLSGILFSKEMTKVDMDKTSNDFANAARKLKDAGFDAVELHMGHGYLLSQFLSPWTNKRKDAYGGSIENRARYPLEVLKNVRKSVGADFPILVKLNLEDGFEGGFNLEECKYVCQALERGGCSAVVLSGGFTSRTPFYLMRGDIPLKGMIANGTSIAEKLTMALFGPWIIKKYTFEPNFFLKQALEIRKAVKIPLVYLGGVDSRAGIQEIMKAGFDFIALGRPLIHDSNFLTKMERNEIEKSGCTRCNECVVEMDRGGVRCVLN
ncbi:MAG: NADH:flavin oxidoreductase [Chitinophagales bacterium]|nr:NADH:flavin oxidoreductase [Chitinophagales bacterium]